MDISTDDLAGRRGNLSDDDIWDAIVDAMEKAITYGPMVILVTQFLRGYRVRSSDFDDILVGIIDAMEKAITYGPVVILVAKAMRGHRIRPTDFASLLPTVLLYIRKRCFL